MSSHGHNGTPEPLHATYNEDVDTASKRNSATGFDSPKHHSERHHSNRHRSSKEDGIAGVDNVSGEASLNYSGGYPTSEAPSHGREHVSDRVHDIIDQAEDKVHLHHGNKEQMQEQREYAEELDEVPANGHHANGHNGHAEPDEQHHHQQQQQEDEYPEEEEAVAAVANDEKAAAEEEAQAFEAHELATHEPRPLHNVEYVQEPIDGDNAEAAPETAVDAEQQEQQQQEEEREGAYEDAENVAPERIIEDATAEEWRELGDAQRAHHHPHPHEREPEEEQPAALHDGEEQPAVLYDGEEEAVRGAQPQAEEGFETATTVHAPLVAAIKHYPDINGNGEAAPSAALELRAEEAVEAMAPRSAAHDDENNEGKKSQPSFAPLKRSAPREHLVHPDARNRRVVRWNAVPFDPRDDSDDEMELSTCMTPVYEDEDGAGADGNDELDDGAAQQHLGGRKSEYKNGKPRVTGEVTSCFEEPNLLYRIVNEDDKSWAFYNDTRTYEMHVQFIFGKQSKLEALGNTTLRKQDDGSFVAEVIVDPTETEPFVRGRVNGFTSKLHAVPLTEDYHASCRDVANATIDAEVAAIRRVCDSRNAEVVLRACLINNLPFVDPEFPPRQSSLDAGAAKPFKPLAWARPSTFLPTELAGQVRLFRARPRAGAAVDAGDLGDSWLLCAISCISEDPQRLVDLFRHPNGKAAAQREHALGAYRVTICKHGWWRSVLVDDYLPISAAHPKFARSATDRAEIWPCIIEKAFAKLHGSYGKIATGDPLHALSDLTGFSTYRFDDALVARDELAIEFFDDLMRAIQSRYTVICSTPGKEQTLQQQKPKSHGKHQKHHQETDAAQVAETYRAAGLLLGHAYTVIDAKHFPEIDTRLVKLRNAWQREVQWTGDWANGDAKWEEYPEVAEACGVVDGRTTNGYDDANGEQEANKRGGGATFWVPWEAVQKFFNGGGVCFSHTPAYDYRLNCAFNDCVPSTVLELDVQTPTWMTFSISQEDKRCRNSHTEGNNNSGEDSAAGEYQPVMISITSPAEEGEDAAYRVILNSTVNGSCPSSDKWTFLQARDVSLIYKFEPGRYIVVPRLMAMDGQAQQVPFVLGVVSNREIGSGEVAVSFRRLAPDNRIFENFPKFEPELLNGSEVQYQKKLPGAGFPQTQMGVSVE